MQDNLFIIENSSLPEEVLSKKRRLEEEPSSRRDVFEYLEGMEVLDSEVKDRVMEHFKSYDYSIYTEAHVRRALESNTCSIEDFKALLSPAAAPFLEDMAEKASRLTSRHFGNTVYFFTPLYIANYCENYCVYCGFNDRVDVALASGADGVHVGSSDEAVAEIRKRVGSSFIIGATAKTVEQARMAESQGADYLGVGACFPSPTKEAALGISLEDLEEITASVSIPSVAIGGLSLDNIGLLEGRGMRGLAVVSALFGAEDIRLAAEELRAGAEELCRPQEII